MTEEDLLHMVGLDAYMMIRYIHICFKITAFISFWGVFVLAPVFGTCVIRLSGFLLYIALYCYCHILYLVVH